MGRNRFVMLVLSNVDVCVPEAADIAIPSPDSFLRNSTATVLLCLTTIEHQTLAPLKLPLELQTRGSRLENGTPSDCRIPLVPPDTRFLE